MDYEGQGFAEKLSRIIVTLFGAVGLIWGYMIQHFSQTCWILVAGFALAFVLTVPPWPMYRKKPLNWHKPKNTEDQSNKTKKKK